jgi:hypothetical protein
MTLIQLIGLMLLLDDSIRYRDFLKFDRLHHWHVGAVLLVVG